MGDYYLVLEDNLLEIFYNFQQGQCNINQNLLFKLLNFYKKHLTNVKQLKRIGMNDPSLLKQLAGQGYINQTLEDLTQETKLKIILSSKNSQYPYVNINGDIFESNFTATYCSGNDRDKALKHIVELIQSGDKIEIYDKYIFHNNGNNYPNPSEHPSVQVIETFLNRNTSAHFKVICKNTSRIIRRRIDYLNQQFQNRISFSFNGLNNHDRYIRVYKDKTLLYEIIITSGIFNLLNPNIDMTYIVRVF